MVRTADLNLKSISFLQQEIMRYIHKWVIDNNTPVPQKEILKHLMNKGEKKSTLTHSLHGLLRTGWIREAVSMSGGYDRTEYVECRTL